MSKIIRERDIHGSKLVKRFKKLLAKIRSCAERENSDPRRDLGVEQLAGHLLFYFYSPILTSLRSIQRASEFNKVQKLLGCPRVALGSLSEAMGVFDADLLRRAIHELVAEVRGGKKLPAELKGLTAVDGTFLKAVPRMTWALFRKDERYRGAKAHVLFDVSLGVPVDASVTAANASEKEELRKKLQPGRLYVIDAGYVKYKLFADIIEAGSSFICRVRDDAVCDVIEYRELSAEARAAGVRSDRIVRIGDWAPRKDLEHPVHIIEFQRPRTRANEDPEPMMLVTDRLDLEPELIALAYRYRWSIELFFRWFKCVLGCRTLISRSENGVAIQVYMAIIASLLISVWLGCKPNKALLELISFYLMNMVDDDEFEAALRRLQRHKKAT